MSTTIDRPEEDVFADCGGQPRMKGGERVWWFGWNPSDPTMTAAVTSPFDADEDVPLMKGDRVCLWKFRQIVNGGEHGSYSWQTTGSCVSAGSENAMSVLQAYRILRVGKAGVWKRPFTLAAYGYGRKMAFNDDTPGEGSTGDAQAQALRDFGFCDADADITGLPKATQYKVAHMYSKTDELKFSAARNCPPAVKDACKAHRLKFTKITSIDQLETEIRRGRPATVAGNWGSRMQMRYRGTGKNRVLFGDHASSWEHQQSLIGLHIHPEFGRLWYIMNQWYMLSGGVAVPVHGAPATDEPPGGYWVDDSMIQHQLSYRFGEIRTYADLDNPFTAGLLGVLGV